jgi:predicted transcriptional regulator
MPRTSLHPKEANFNLRLDATLKAAFTRAAEAADRPAAQLLRDFMRDYVKRQEREAWEAEVRRQSLAAAARATDPTTDDHASLQEFAAFLDENHFADEWKA